MSHQSPRKKTKTNTEKRKIAASEKKLKAYPVKRSPTKNRSVHDDVTIDLKQEKNYTSALSLIKREFKKQPVTPMPEDIKPMLATSSDTAFNDSGWQFEIKWDGYRSLAYINNGKVQLRSRNNLSFTQKYHPITNELQKWGINAVLDGEIAVLNEEGKSDFNAMQYWNTKTEGELLYYVFDLLWLDGIDLREKPLFVRRSLLKKILPEKGIIRFSDDIEEWGSEFFKIAQQNNLEGIIAKKKDSVYDAGMRTKDWLKIKAEQRHEAVICGYTKKKDTDRVFSSLILGVNEGDKFTFIGQVGTGFTQKLQAELLKKMRPLTTATCPFTSDPPIADPVVWLRPHLVCEVKYTELTKEGVMRHASFQGLREDKTILDLNDERGVDISPTPTGNERVLFTKEEEKKLVEVEGQTLKLTNLKKIFWVKEKYTKGDLLNYYYQVAPYMLPYMKDRPQSLHRFPNGSESESFYQKNMAGKIDSWLKTFRRVSESSNQPKHFLVCADEATLIYMANLGCIEMNPWHSTVQFPDNPTWSVVDLDPAAISFEKVIETALMVKQVLDALGVDSFPKTSGSTGIHIYIPFGERYTYEQSKQFAELIAILVHQQLPDFTSIERNPLKRKDKIYIDYLQNRPIQTISAPYSVRPKPGATVSAPLDWSEVMPGLQMKQFTMKNMMQRIQAEGDLFTGVLGKPVDLQKIMHNLAALT
ncbi:MAG: DNA ligase D [Bacteroidota bacterium]|nr:DNA ligase D [Bacteroidota bacterium]